MSCLTSHISGMKSDEAFRCFTAKAKKIQWYQVSDWLGEWRDTVLQILPTKFALYYVCLIFSLHNIFFNSCQCNTVNILKSIYFIDPWQVKRTH